MDELTEKLGKLDIVAQKRPKYPKGKRTAYVLFMIQQNMELKNKSQSFPSIGQFSKFCSIKWKETPKRDKEKFEKKAKEDVLRYEKEMAEYEKQKALYDKFVDEAHDKGVIQELAASQKLPLIYEGSHKSKNNKKEVTQKSTLNINTKTDLKVSKAKQQKFKDVQSESQDDPLSLDNANDGANNHKNPQHDKEEEEDDDDMEEEESEEETDDESDDQSEGQIQENGLSEDEDTGDETHEDSGDESGDDSASDSD